MSRIHAQSAVHLHFVDVQHVMRPCRVQLNTKQQFIRMSSSVFKTADDVHEVHQRINCSSSFKVESKHDARERFNCKFMKVARTSRDKSTAQLATHRYPPPIIFGIQQEVGAHDCNAHGNNHKDKENE
jgi:hypothetical protein